MTGREIIVRYLTREEYWLWCHNMTIHDYDINNALNMDYEIFGEVIRRYFQWGNTAEGGEYWHDIWERVDEGRTINDTVEPVEKKVKHDYGYIRHKFI